MIGDGDSPPVSLHKVLRCGRPRASNLRQCAVEGCSGRAYKDNPYCPKCTRRYQRHDDPAMVKTRGRKAKG